MKRAGNLWSQIITTENLMLAHRQARKGKSYYKEVKMVNADIDRYIKEIQSSLTEKTFTTSPYKVEVRSDGRKVRTIHKLPYYPDRIVQHALMNIVGPILVRGFIRDSFQSITGRGTSDAARRVKKLVRSENAPKFALKVDVEKYYPSVDNEILKSEVRRKIKCSDTLWLIDNIIDSTQGLPIGNYTSQHFGNLYLNRFDWWMKQEIKPKGYFRYCDDIVVMDDDASTLIKIKAMIEQKMSLIGLKIKSNWQLYDVKRSGVDFVGFLFRPSYTRLRKNIANSMRSVCDKLSKVQKMPKNAINQLMAYRGWVKQSSSKHLWRESLTPRLYACFPNQLKRAV